MKKNQGFTLIELLLATVILGILAVLSFASYGSAQTKSRDSRRKADLEMIRGALELYKADNNEYPDTASYSGGTLITGGYMKDILTDPKDGASYQYTSDGSEYFLRACLEKDPAQEDECAACSGSLNEYCITNP